MPTPLAIAFLNLAFLASPGPPTFSVKSVSPSNGSLHVTITDSIVVHFDQAVLPSSITPASFLAYGRWSGPVGGTFAFSNENQTVTLTPDAPFSSGEAVLVILSHDIQAASGAPFRAAGYAFRFWTRTRPACLAFQELDTFSNRTTPSQQTRIYGALGSDLDNDGWLDIVTVNEVSADLRIFMNTADGTGLFHPFLQPPEPGLLEMSPNEPGDFNHDGFADVCVCATAADRVLIFLGAGDGTFLPAQIIQVGDRPLGVAVLDVDGDGDSDIVNGNFGTSNLSRLLNNGNGVFGAPTFFEGGVNGEYGIAAADMDEDGIMDLVVGGNSSQQIAVRRGLGNGTFAPLSVQASGGPVWQIGTGDVNGDGREDVHTSNSFNASGSILLNTGGGNLAPPQVENVTGHAPATDLGDFDGDGDLDWLLSSFGGGIWRLFLNDGAGNFTPTQDFAAPNNPSCGTLMDLDNDRDLDIVLLDEIADVVILMENIDAPGDANCDGAINVNDLLIVVGAWGPCGKGGCPADLNADGVVNVNDLLLVIGNWDP